MIVLMNALFDVGLQNFVPEIFALKMNPKWSTYSNPGKDLRTLVETDPSQTVRGIAEALGVSSHAVFDGLKRVGRVKELEKWVPHDLIDRQKLSRFEVCSSLLLHNQNDAFLDQSVTCDKK